MNERRQRTQLPGEGLVRRGISDLEHGVESEEALLVSIEAPRLRRLGLALPEPIASPEHRLYALLHSRHGDPPRARPGRDPARPSADQGGVGDQRRAGVSCHFIPLPQGWRERSPLAGREDLLTFRTFDF